MTVFSRLNTEISTKKHKELKLIAIKTDKSQKELVDEGLDYLRDKYKDCLEGK